MCVECIKKDLLIVSVGFLNTCIINKPHVVIYALVKVVVFGADLGHFKTFYAN